VRTALLEQFVHVGMDEATVRSFGELPKGRGVLGALIETPEPIRLRRISDDERSSGFPPGHPEMTSFLGVPIRSRVRSTATSISPITVRDPSAPRMRHWLVP
jgi:hypothetical protein